MNAINIVILNFFRYIFLWFVSYSLYDVFHSILLFVILLFFI